MLVAAAVPDITGRQVALAVRVVAVREQPALGLELPEPQIQVEAVEVVGLLRGLIQHLAQADQVS